MTPDAMKWLLLELQPIAKTRNGSIYHVPAVDRVEP